MSDAEHVRSPALWVVVNEGGDIVGSNYMPAGESRGVGPVNSGRPVAGPGQRVLEIGATEEMHLVDSAATFHARLATLMSAAAKQG